MRILKLAAATAVFMAVAASAQAGDYWAVNVVDEGIMLLDAGSVNATGKMPQADTVIVLKTAIPVDGANVDYMVSREEFDCSANKSRTLRSDAYSANGTKVAPINETPGDWSNSTVSNVGMSLVCKKGAKPDEGTHFGDHPMSQMVEAFRKVK